VKRRSPLIWARDKTSDMERVLVKPLKPCRKFSVKGTKARSSGLSAAEKASTAKALVAPSSATKGGMKRDPQLPLRGMRLATCLLVNLWTTFLDCGGFMSIIALILLRLAPIPFTDTKHPSTFLCVHQIHIFLH
jgi:hypothetical protein